MANWYGFSRISQFRICSISGQFSNKKHVCANLGLKLPGTNKLRVRLVLFILFHESSQTSTSSLPAHDQFGLIVVYLQCEQLHHDLVHYQTICFTICQCRDFAMAVQLSHYPRMVDTSNMYHYGKRVWTTWDNIICQCCHDPDFANVLVFPFCSHMRFRDFGNHSSFFQDHPTKLTLHMNA